MGNGLTDIFISIANFIISTADKHFGNKKE